MENSSERADYATRFQGNGVGIGKKQQSIAVHFPQIVNEILRSMTNRSEYIRNAVIRQLMEDGLLADE